MRCFFYIQKSKCKAKQLFLMLLFLLFGISTHAQDVKIKVEASPQKITIGDYVTLKYTATFNPQKVRVSLPKLLDTFNHFEMVESKKIDSLEKQDELILSQENIISNYDSGTWYIPAATFAVQPLDGSEPYEIKADSLLIQVATVAVDTSQPMKPIYEIIEAKAPWWEMWLYILGAIIALLLLVGLFYYYRKYVKSKANKTSNKPQNIETPWQKAKRLLGELKDKKLWESEQEKEHHTEITDVLRTYLEETFGLDCFEKTSQEIVTDVKKTLQKRKFKKRGEVLDFLRNVLVTADLVKFAKSKPTVDEHIASLHYAEQFIESTSAFVINEQIEQQKQAKN